MDEKLFSGEKEKLVKCEVTGKEVPEDEIVDFQGRKVSAEGKERLLELLKSGERQPGEFDVPTAWRRTTSIFIDSFLMFIVLFAMSLIASSLLGSYYDTSWYQEIHQVIFICIFIGYLTAMHGILGQSYGKVKEKIKVIKRDGKPLGIKTAFLRAFYFCVPLFLMPIIHFLIAANYGVGAKLFYSAHITIASLFVINLIVAILDGAEQRTIHDRLAGTRVVMAD